MRVKIKRISMVKEAIGQTLEFDHFIIEAIAT
jgi:hypothetical protein